MPALPWVERQPIDPSRVYISMASRLPLRSHRFVAMFLWDTLNIRKQLASTPGLVGYALYAQLGHKTFWTFSLWEDQVSLDSFASSDPHQALTQRLRGRMGESRFKFDQVRGADVPLDWDTMKSGVR
jgi:heme-degrading monooxygenase HmoA